MKTCRKCGSTDRYANCKCKPCWKIYHAKWRAEHRDVWRAYGAKWEAENPEKKREGNALYRSKHKEQQKVLSAKWYAENKGKVAARHKKWNLEHPEERRAKRAKHYAENTEKVLQQTAKWQSEHPELTRRYKANRRAKERQSTGTLSKGLVEKLFALQKGKCPCCGLALGKDYHLDHRMPIALGGAHEDSNMQLLRKRCNLKKNAKHPVDFMRQQGFLL